MAMLAALLVGPGAGGALAQSPDRATAELQDNEGEPAGTAEFVEGQNGVTITVEVSDGVEPGRHGIHIHETADLSSSDFESAGDHFNPTDAKHGFDNPEGPHAGDLKNITVSEDGTASYQTVNDRITLSEGSNAVLDKDGSALIIHEMADDNRTNDDPETGPGMSGDRVAAGAIEPAGGQTGEPLPDTGGMSIAPAAFLAALLLAGGAGLALASRLARRT